MAQASSHAMQASERKPEPVGKPVMAQTQGYTRRGSILEGRYAVWAVEAAYVALLGFLFGKLIYTFIEPLSTPYVAPRVAERVSQSDSSIFSRFNPFTAAPVSESQAVIYEEVEETRLALTLVGTFVMGDRPSATIQSEGGRQQLFYIGDEVVSGTMISDILADRVILSRRGVRETLSLEGREKLATSSRPQEPRGLEALARRAQPSMITRFVRMAPHSSGKGIVVSAGSEPRLFAAAGFLDGDVIIAANGRALPPDVSQAQTLLVRQLSRGPVTTTINRSGVTLDIVIDPSGLAP